MKKSFILCCALLMSILAMAQTQSTASNLGLKNSCTSILTGVISDCHSTTMIMARINYHYFGYDDDLYYIFTEDDNNTGYTPASLYYYNQQGGAIQKLDDGFTRTYNCGMISKSMFYTDAAAVTAGGHTVYPNIKAMVDAVTQLEENDPTPNYRPFDSNFYVGYIMDSVLTGTAPNTQWEQKPVLYIIHYDYYLHIGQSFDTYISVSKKSEANTVNPDPTNTMGVPNILWCDHGNKRNFTSASGITCNPAQAGKITTNSEVAEDRQCANNTHYLKLTYAQSRYDNTGKPFTDPWVGIAKLDITTNISESQVDAVGEILKRFRAEYPTFDEGDYATTGFVAKGTFTAADAATLTQHKQAGNLLLYQDQYEQYIPAGVQISNWAFPILSSMIDQKTGEPFTIQCALTDEYESSIWLDEGTYNNGFIWGLNKEYPRPLLLQRYSKRIYKNDTIKLRVKTVYGEQVPLKEYELTETNYYSWKGESLVLKPDLTTAPQEGDIITFTVDVNKSQLHIENGVFKGFKEGYYYTFKEKEEEGGSVSNAPAYNAENGPQRASVVTSCTAHPEFTLKILSEYAIYCGHHANNTTTTDQEEWNLDDNWKVTDRMGYTYEQFAPGYAPAEKTKVFIRGERAVLPKSETQNDSIEIALRTNSLCIFEDGYKINTCDSIHFDGEPCELGFQHRLNYNAAFYDIRMKHKTWNVVAFPHKDMVSGDIYADPLDWHYHWNVGSKIFVDPYINDTTFTDKNVRVWQKLYNHDMENMTWSGLDTIKSTAWNTPANTVKYRYNPGTAVMIWPYVLFDHSEAILSETDNRACFHFPKPDTRYYYYSWDRDYECFMPTDTYEDIDLLPGETKRNPRLAYEVNNTDMMEITLTATSASDLFAFGNPTVDLINIADFLKANQDVLTGTYYVIEGNEGTVTASPQPSIGKANSSQTSSLRKAGWISPTEAIMVQAKNAATTLTVKLPVSALKAAKDRETTTVTPAPAAHVATTPVLYMTAQCKKQTSYASIYESSEASNGFNIDEDAEMLFIDNKTTPAAVYTIADNRALAINGLATFTNVPMAIYSVDSTATTAKVTFNGVNSFNGDISLLDIVTGKTTLIAEGDVLTLKTTSQNDNIRYYLQKTANTTTDTEIVENNDIDIFVANDGTIQVVANDELINVVVYSATGQEVINSHVNNRFMSYSLPTGVYMVKAYTQHSQTIKKVVVK